MLGVPQRWHLHVVALAPRVGSKPGKQRPCLAIQPTEFAGALGPVPEAIRDEVRRAVLEFLDLL